MQELGPSFHRTCKEKTRPKEILVTAGIPRRICIVPMVDVFVLRRYTKLLLRGSDDVVYEKEIINRSDFHL